MADLEGPARVSKQRSWDGGGHVGPQTKQEATAYQGSWNLHLQDPLGLPSQGPYVGPLSNTMVSQLTSLLSGDTGSHGVKWILLQETSNYNISS